MKHWAAAGVKCKVRFATKTDSAECPAAFQYLHEAADLKRVSNLALVQRRAPWTVWSAFLLAATFVICAVW